MSLPQEIPWRRRLVRPLARPSKLLEEIPQGGGLWKKTRLARRGKKTEKPFARYVQEKKTPIFPSFPDAGKVRTPRGQERGFQGEEGI